MKGIELLDDKHWSPFSYFGYTQSYLSLDQHTIIYTWIALACLLALSLFARASLARRSSNVRYLTLTAIRAFSDLCTQSFGYFSFTHTSFIVALFLFIVACNCVAVIPFVEEPTKDLNTTLALGILTFLYIQYFAIKTHGFWHYLKEYFTPFFLMFPLHIVGKLSTIISISFRLFGNIFGGATIVHIYTALISSWWLLELLFLPLNIVMIGFFIIFEGFLQAFVFTMLTITYLAIALSPDEMEMT